MTQEQKPKTTRGAVLGRFLAAQRLQNQGAQVIAQGPAEDSQVGQGQLFNLQSIGSQVDAARGRFQTSSGWQPGFFMARFQARQAERLRAVTTQRNTMMAVNSEPEDKRIVKPPPPAPQPTFACPWANEGCTFTTDSPDVLKAHVAEHTRFHPKSY